MTTLAAPLLGALVMILAVGSASAQDMKVRSPHDRDFFATRAAKLRTSAIGVDPDTVWIGHVTQTLGYGPYHIGRGPRRISGGTNGGGPDSKPSSSYEGTWNFDRFQAGETDTLQGWWPIQGPFASVGPSDKDDCLRPWFALDYGNTGNYQVGSPAAPKKTFGVTGYWHADNGGVPTLTTPGTNPVSPNWTPISGSASAWCGLRSHGDLSYTDVTGTGNAINDDLASFQGNNSGRQTNPQTGVVAGVGGTDHNFPGYGSQWDQMLYRDVTLPANLGGGQNFNISFNYSTNMSELSNGTHSSQTGFFYFDPLKTVNGNCSDGNFISAAASASGPVDSFMVYIGSPVEKIPGLPPPIPIGSDGNDYVASDGLFHEVFDEQRRWFSEVVKKDSYAQILTSSGVRATTGLATTVANATVNAILDADGVASDGGKIRIVFRIKTNRGFDDENFGNGAFSSGGAGAAIVDDVLITGPSGTLLNDGFEGANGGVDNATGTAATAAWKSTGKPPGTWFHVHNISTLPFVDPCGLVLATVRLCNMGGNVLSPGLHDLGDKTGGVFGGNVQDEQKYVVSPTLNLMSTGSGSYNGMGIDAEIASRKGLFLIADQLWNVYDYNISTGNGWRIGWQSYPAVQSNGVKCWGEMRKDITFSATGGILGCFDTFESSAYDEQLIVTTNVGGIPDSVRCYIESMSRCYTLPLDLNNCSPVSGARAGGYFDNLSIGFFKLTPAALAMSFGTNFNDCFPYNPQNKAVTAFGLAYDTLAARIQTGNNIAANSKNDLTGDGARECIAGDSAIVVGSGDQLRMDLVFRILPGVGNYVTIGNRPSGVARRPDTVPRVAAATSDVSLPNHVDRFWGSYMGNTGAFGTGGNGTTGIAHDPDGAGPIVAGTQWDPNAWNSARMDTLEQNFFPCDAIQKNISTNPSGALVTSTYMTAYHESDPRYTVVGFAKNRCFLNKNKQPVKIKPGQINCGGPDFAAFPPNWTADVGSGYNPAEIAGQPGATYEFTKILPDGQFTPGTEIQYFFRRALIPDPIATFSMTPDTNFVLPNDTPFTSFDGHRWFEISVLPDRWKNAAFGGDGMACMLVVDAGDRRGDEFVWVSVADSIGLTATGKRGAHNGWRARSDQDVTVNVGADNSICRRDNGGQPGTLWDLYEVPAGESNFPAGRLGSRAASHIAAPGSYTKGKWSTAGPSEDMLKNYKSLVWLNADLGEDGIGPVPNQTDDDIGLLTSFVALTGGVQTLPRTLMMMGYDLADALHGAPLGTPHAAFMSTWLRAGWRAGDYRALSTNSNNTSSVEVKTPVGVALTTYGIGNQCFVDNDVFTVETPVPAGQTGATYENLGGGGGGPPYVAAVYAPESATHNSRTLAAGWTLGLFGGGFGTTCVGCATGGQDLFLNVGVRKFLFEIFTNAFGGLNCQPTGTPVGVGDNPGSGAGSAFVNFMNLRSSNPMHSGETRLSFGLARTEKVELRVYDVTGRVVKTVANRVFAGGTEHVVIWNGTDEAGNHVKSGVYFYQLRTPTWTSQKKLAVLAN